jgi:hypothetical protein
MGLGFFAQDTQLNPLSHWDVIDFCDETTELMDAAIQTSAKSRDELIAMHTNTVYQFQDYKVVLPGCLLKLIAD